MTSRVLIISCNCFSKTSNNGKTLLNLFSGWDPKEVYQFYTHNEIPDFNNKYNLFRITDEDIINFRIGKTKKCGKVIAEYNYSNNVSNTRMYLFENFKRFVRDVIWKNNNWYNYGLMQWVEECKPDFIFFVGLNNPYLFDLCFYIRDKFHLPIIVYLTDDYIHSKFSLSPFYWIRLFALRKRYKRMINNNTALITVNDVMKKEYQRIFSTECYLLTNYVKTTFKDYSLSKNKIKKIVFIGNLLHGRWKTILRFSKMIMGENYVIEVYPGNSITKSVKKRMMCKNNIIVGDFLNAEQVFEKINQSDFVLHVESFAYSDICLARYSLSTKITEYAAYCKPIIAFCPNEVASYKILKENELAICIDNKKNISYISLLNDEAFLKKIVKKAYQYFDNQRESYGMDNMIFNLYLGLKNNENI